MWLPSDEKRRGDLARVGGLDRGHDLRHVRRRLDERMLDTHRIQHRLVFLVRGFIAAMECDSNNGAVVNVGSGFEISVGDTAGTIAELMGAQVEIECEAERLRPPNSEVDRLF